MNNLLTPLSTNSLTELLPFPSPSLEIAQPTYALISVHGDPTAPIGKEGAGGQNIYVRELALGLAKRGCQVDIFTRREDTFQSEIEELAPGCRTIRLIAGPSEFIDRNDLFCYLPAFTEALLEFQKLSGRRYTLVHSNYWLSGWVGLQLKFRLGIPQVHTYHSIGAVKYRGCENPPAIASIRHGVERDCLEQADCVISTSPQEVEDLRQLVSEHGRIKIVPCGINTEHFGSVSKEESRQRLGIAPKANIVMYVGRFDPRKGIETLVKACAQIPQQFQLFLVGGSREGGSDYIEQQRIRTLVKAHNLDRVTVFTGQISQEHLPAYYAAANICVVPSYYEPFGLVAIEAMAARTPVIASNVGGLRHTIADRKTGLLVPPCNPKALAVAIWEMLDRPKQCLAYGIEGRKWVESRFSNEAIAAQIHTLYQSFTISESVGEIQRTKTLTADLEQRIQMLLNSKRCSSREIAELEQLVEALHN